jgi:hypothetical protein
MIEKLLKIMFIIKIYTKQVKNEHDDDETVSRAFKRREKGTSATHI